jgi:hypothetical protein
MTKAKYVVIANGKTYTFETLAAFPVPVTAVEGMGVVEVREYGMSLRDWFAGQALAYWLKHQMENDCYPKNEPLAERWAYQTADAMLAEREKGGGR